MMGFVFLVVIALIFAVVWIYLARRPGPRAKIGPDGTNVRNPETFVVHHEGKAQGLDIANTALKERTENLRRDLPGDADAIKAAIPGRDTIRLDQPPSDVSKYGDEKVAPGATPGEPGAEPKAKVLMEGPVGSRPETPEEPGSPYQKGRRVTDIHRDVELAEEVLPVTFGRGQMDRDQAVSPATTGQEPGYGLGRTGPGQTDGEGGPESPVEQPELDDELTDIPNGEMPTAQVAFEADAEFGAEVDFFPSTLGPDPQTNWAALQEYDPLPDSYPEDGVTAIVRNPRSLYVYWERGGEAEQRVRDMLGDAAFEASQPCLRVFDVATEGAYTINVGEHDDHWFINDLEPGHRYVVSYERRTDDGRFYTVALSNPVFTPAETAGQTGLLYDQLAQMGGDVASSPWR